MRMKTYNKIFTVSLQFVEIEKKKDEPLLTRQNIVNCNSHTHTHANKTPHNNVKMVQTASQIASIKKTFLPEIRPRAYLAEGLERK